MSRRFTGKVAVVTGGNSGIGLATAKAYAREGARVAITGRSEESLATAAKEIGSETLAIRADVTRLPEIDRAVERIKERFGRIDALFVNAGIGKFVPFEEVTEAFYDETMNANLKGAFFTVQRAAPLFTEGAGVVLNASINAHMGMPGSTVYGATKAAVVNLAKTMSADLLARGVRVNVVSPGPIETPIFGRMGMNDEQLGQMKEWITGQVPLKRFGHPDEIASAVLYLTSDESRFVVGTELVVDGGMIGL
jgi:NAD(P)-dependent dehydrogenase (short-subunit alcohol dehydrogenase family)